VLEKALDRYRLFETGSVGADPAVGGEDAAIAVRRRLPDTAAVLFRDDCLGIAQQGTI